MVTSHHLPKKRGALKGTRISLFLEHLCGLSQWRLRWGCRGLRFVLDLSDQQYTLLFCMILHDIVVCLFLYVLGCLYDIFVYVAMIVC